MPRALLALACTVIGLALLVLLIPAAPLTGDGRSYVEFVRNGLQGGASSWHERRLLGPLIVSALPMDTLQGFLVLTLVSLGVAAMLTWRAAVVLLGDSLRALVAIPLLLGTWVVAPNIREYALVDPLAWAFVAGVWLCTLQRQWVVAAVIAAVGVLAKEVVLLAAVAAAAAAWSPLVPLRAVMVFAPAALGVIALTLLFPGSGTDAFAYITKWVQDGLGSIGPARVLFLIFASYAALWLLVPNGWLLLPAHVRRGGAVFLLAAPVLPFIGSPERMLEAIFPVVISAAVLATATWPLWMVGVLALGNLLFVARVGGDARVPTAIAWGGLALAVGMVAWAWLRPGRGALLGRLAPTRGGPRDTTAPST